MKKNSLVDMSRRWLLQNMAAGLTLVRWASAAAASSPAEEEVRHSERTLLHHVVTLDELQPLPGEAPLVAKPRTITILHLWAVECPPCVEELPLLRKVADSYTSRPELQLLLACETEDDRVLQSFLAKHQEQMPTRGRYKLGLDSRLRTGLGVNNQPLTLLLDQKLVVRQAFIGTLKNRREEFDNAVNRLSFNLREQPVSAPLQTLGRLKLPQSGLRRLEDSILHCRYQGPEVTAGRLFVVRIYNPNDPSGDAEDQQMRVRQAAFRTWEDVRFVYVRQPESPLMTLLLDEQGIIRQMFIGPLANRANEFAEGMNWLHRILRDKSR